jgi:DNA polymerase III delta prime subunit
MTIFSLKVAYDDGGLEAIIFTAEGDMRQALNNAQVKASQTKPVFFLF